MGKCRFLLVTLADEYSVHLGGDHFRYPPLLPGSVVWGLGTPTSRLRKTIHALADVCSGRMRVGTTDDFGFGT
jgi:hypothetical protein